MTTPKDFDRLRKRKARELIDLLNVTHPNQVIEYVEKAFNFWMSDKAMVWYASKNFLDEEEFRDACYEQGIHAVEIPECIAKIQEAKSELDEHLFKFTIMLSRLSTEMRKCIK